MLQLLPMRIYQINNILSGFISQPCIYPETIWCQIVHIRNFYPFYPSLNGTLLGTLDNFWAKQTFGKFDVFWTPLETGCLITLETDTPLLTGLSGVTISTWVGILVVSSSRSGLNQVSFRSINSCKPICDMCCTRYFQFGGILTSLMNGTFENSSSNITWNSGQQRIVSLWSYQKIQFPREFKTHQIYQRFFLLKNHPMCPIVFHLVREKKYKNS